MATLVHDDVLDGAPLRRGRPTVFAAGGRRRPPRPATCSSRAFAVLAATGSRRRWAPLARLDGVGARRADAARRRVERGRHPARYLERCRLKTASLFDASLPARGALRGRARDGRPAGRFGEGVGLAFQLLDDVLDVSGPAPHRQAPRNGPARRDGHAAAHPRPGRDPGAGTARPSRAVTGPRRRRPYASASRRPARSTRRAGRPSITWPRRSPPWRGCRCRTDRTEALNLVADGVVERYA